MPQKKRLTVEHRKNISLAHKGKKRKPFTKEHRANMSKAHKGRKLSPEHTKKIIKALRVYWKQQIQIHGRKIPLPKGYKQVKKGSKLPKQWVKNQTAGKLRYYENNEVWNKGKKHSKKTRDKISRAMKKKYNGSRRGKKRVGPRREEDIRK